MLIRPLTKLIYAVSNFLPTNKINFLRRVYSDLMEHKISRGQMVGFCRKLVGDRLILAAIGLYNSKISSNPPSLCSLLDKMRIDENSSRVQESDAGGGGVDALKRIASPDGIYFPCGLPSL
ncbi:uncharacterized protein A4U43_C10F15300 [Asparagus officinalis]|uniref:RST domain-containing protein n=1 Tax=Asparagus officinalis TaxID=4686 RepID=A0A5P1E3D2_ASPOF|nr:uncharacterized protein A4U43_C10F15300 [Asparagus officinalis]